MAAIVGYILDERFSEPAISELVVTSDGFVLTQAEDEVGANGDALAPRWISTATCST